MVLQRAPAQRTVGQVRRRLSKRRRRPQGGRSGSGAVERAGTGAGSGRGHQPVLSVLERAEARCAARLSAARWISARAARDERRRASARPGGMTGTARNAATLSCAWISIARMSISVTCWFAPQVGRRCASLRAWRTARCPRLEEPGHDDDDKAAPGRRPGWRSALSSPYHSSPDTMRGTVATIFARPAAPARRAGRAEGRGRGAGAGQGGVTSRRRKPGLGSLGGVRK